MDLRSPNPWLAALPLILGGLMLPWAWGAAVHPGMQLGRGSGVLLLVGCLLALALPGRLSWHGRGPQVWLALALLWQAIALAGWAVIREPGLLWWGERAAALLTAVGIALWTRGQPPERLLATTASVGAGCLVVCAGSAQAWAMEWPIGPDIPFGNPNFVVGGALPLLGLGLVVGRTWWRWPLAAGVVAAVVLGTGLASGDAVRAVWPILGAMLGSWLLLKLPLRSHLWVVGVGAVAVLGALALLLLGVITVPQAAPSTGYRVELWRSAVQAIGQAPWFGTGPASGIVVLQEQLASPAAWLWVPSYAEHAHQEYLNAVLEGGVVLGALLLAGLLATLIPLWHRRAEPVHQALLIAWSGVLTAAMIESHLGQPGPLVLLALLAGITWSQTQQVTSTESRLQQGAALLIAVLCFAQLAREFTDGGSPTMIEFRAGTRMATAVDQHAVADIAAETRRRLGDLATLPTIEGIARAKAKAFPRAENLVILQLQRLPVDPDAVDLALRLRERHRQREEACPLLDAALEQARTRGSQLLLDVPTTPKSVDIRARLAVLYPRI